MFAAAGYKPTTDEFRIAVDINDVPSKQTTSKSNIVLNAVKVLILNFTKNITRNATLESVPDTFKTLRVAVRVEGYLKRVYSRYVEMIWKHDYDFVGDNPKAVTYIKRRFREISKVTNTPTYFFFDQLTEYLVTYHNAFIVKARDKKTSSGSPVKYFGISRQPIAGLFTLNPCDMQVETLIDNATGTKSVVGWTYTDTQGDHKFKLEDVEHIKINPDSGNIFATPPGISVLDDARALRRMEENAELLVFQHSVPLLHEIIGTSDSPGTDPEITTAVSEFENMRANSLIVTTERHKIVPVEIARSTIDITTYLEYFKNRMIVTLGQSLSNIGEGANNSRSTAMTMAKSVLDSAIRYQKFIRIAITDFIIDELLFEGGFDILDEKNTVRLFLPEIDVDEKIRKEFHSLSLYQGNLITESEARDTMGLGPLTDRSETYFELVMKPKILLQNAVKLGTSKATTNKEAPANQYGTKTVGVKARESVLFYKNSADDLKRTITDQFYTYANEVIDMLHYGGDVEHEASCRISKEIVLEKASQVAISIYNDINFNNYDDIEVADLELSEVHHNISIYVNKFFDGLYKHVEDAIQNKNDVLAVFDALNFKIDILIDNIINVSVQ